MTAKSLEGFERFKIQKRFEWISQTDLLSDGASDWDKLNMEQALERILFTICDLAALELYYAEGKHLPPPRPALKAMESPGTILKREPWKYERSNDGETR